MSGSHTPKGLFAHTVRPPEGLSEGLYATLLTGRFLVKKLTLTLVVDSELDEFRIDVCNRLWLVGKRISVD